MKLLKELVKKLPLNEIEASSDEMLDSVDDPQLKNLYRQKETLGRQMDALDQRILNRKKALREIK